MTRHGSSGETQWCGGCDGVRNKSVIMSVGRERRRVGCVMEPYSTPGGTRSECCYGANRRCAGIVTETSGRDAHGFLQGRHLGRESRKVLCNESMTQGRRRNDVSTLEVGYPK